MATLSDLFGGGDDGKYEPRVINLKREGDFIKGAVITKIDNKAPTMEMVRQPDGKYRPGLQKFWVDGKPKPVAEDEAQRAGLRPVTQIMITMKGITGRWEGMPDSIDPETEFRISVTGSANEREAFKAAVMEADSINEFEDGFGKKLIKREGNMKFHEMKVIKKA